MDNRLLKETFNQVVDVYDQYRPNYVKELYEAIFAYKQIDKNSLLVEVGIGTGQASKAFLDTGAKLTAVELGKDLAMFVKDKYRGYENLEIVNTSFEDFVCPKGSIDLIYAATAFHWIDEAAGYGKVFDLLKEGGVFARFANRPYKDKGNEPLDDALQEVFRKYMPANKPGSEFDEARCLELARIPLKYGFSDCEHKLFKRTREFTAEDYSGLLGTYSHTIALEATAKKKFLEEICQVINAHGGKVTIYDTLDLQLARK